MLKKIFWLNVRDVIFSFAYLYQLLLYFFIGNVAFWDGHSSNNSLLLMNLYSAYLSIFVYSLCIGLDNIAVCEKGSSRLELYLANGLSAKKICFYYSVSSFFCSVVVVALLHCVYLLRAILFRESEFLSLLTSKAYVLFICAALVCFFVSLVFNALAFLLKNPIAIRILSVVLFFFIFLGIHILADCFIDNSMPYEKIFSNLLLLSSVISLIAFLVFIVCERFISNERIVLSLKNWGVLIWMGLKLLSWPM